MGGSAVGTRLAQYRHQRGWSQREVERLAGLAHGTLCRIERGTHVPSATVVYRLAQVLGIAVCQLYPQEEVIHVA